MGGVESCCREHKDEVLMVTKMDLSHCGCLEVPNVVFNAERCIETLVLSSNQITSLPPQLFHCQELKHLNLIDNCLSSIPPAIGSLMHLVSLKLDKNNLRDLPENLKNCRKLRRLSLSNNQWKQVPSIVTQLISLEEMYLNDSELSFLPASVGRLTKLKILELRNNNLCNLPLSMARLSSLSRLDIGDNEFTDFPACVNSLKSLTELLIDNNDIEELTDMSNLVNLEHFDASYNHISQLSDTIGCCTNLNMLNLSFNYLEQLPESIGNIEKLETFHLEMNELTEIPKSIGKLKNLEDFNLCNNRLCNIPISIGLLRKLKNFNLSKNTIQEFPPEIGSCTKLSIINAGYNRLQVLPSEIGYLNNLKVLDLVGNFLMYLPITIINLRSIRAIWLSANQNVPLIPFTEDINIASGERFLTNIALPQLGEIPLHNHQSSTESKVVVNEKSSSWSKKIRFAEDDDILPGKLHRTPTPFPKELRAPNRKQHSRTMDDMRSNGNYVNLMDGKPCEELQAPAAPITKNGSGLMNFTESCVTRIREANIRRNNKETNYEGDDTDGCNGGHAAGVNVEGDYFQESNVDYIPMSDASALHNAINIEQENEEPPQLGYLNGVEKGEEDASTTKFEDIRTGFQESNELRNTPAPNIVDEATTTESVKNEETMSTYSNVNGRRQTNSPARFDTKMDAQTIREMYHNDVIRGTNYKPSGMRNGLFESPTVSLNQNRPTHLNLPCTVYPERVSVNNALPPPPPPPLMKNDHDKSLTRQEMITLTEKMRSRNMSPPCYEIAKMYSTKAALFEQSRIENCN